MAKYTGYINVPHSTYDEWRNATNGNGYDADGIYGCQCYDLVLIFWYSVGFPAGYPVSSNLGASGIWDRRLENMYLYGDQLFELVTNPQDIKRGDIIIYNGFPGNEYGHVGFADCDYSDSGWTYPELPVLSENNQGIPDPAGGSYTNIHGYDIRLFKGAFRYIPWVEPEPVTIAERKKHFPWPVAWRNWGGFKRVRNR